MNSEKFIGKICPRCGTEFKCMGDDDCWCEGARLHQKQMLQITQSYNDCLCPDCLRFYEDS